ncbi:hypothetical protein ABZ654_23800 [Streptomyces hygroscopicus]|uniref:hypothetical protein n=1 Tax=Streptomyces hygroscopicus TaxID=1912 RepID=UPI0033EB8646
MRADLVDRLPRRADRDDLPSELRCDDSEQGRIHVPRQVTLDDSQDAGVRAREGADEHDALRTEEHGEGAHDPCEARAEAIDDVRGK